MLLFDQLKALESKGEIINVGLVGGGFMGRGIVEVLEFAPGMRVAGVCDLDLERAYRCFSDMGIPCIEVEKESEAGRINFFERRIVTRDPSVLIEHKDIHFIIEATGKPEVGAEVAFKAIMNKKHMGMVNVETDVTVGGYLSKLARSSGVVYTVCTGDEPAAIKELVDFTRVMGFKIVACGKGKNNPLDRYATPSSLAEKASESGLNPKILTEFVDGSKTMVEMGCVANSTGLDIDVENMHGPSANLDELCRIFRLKEEGGILSTEGVVDFVIGDVAPGVFVVVKHGGNITNKTLRYLKIKGEGDHYLLYRPFHLTNIEVPVSVGIAAIYNQSSMAPDFPFKTEVVAIAKRDMKKGDLIDGIGGNMVYGGLQKYQIASVKNYVPLGLIEGAEVLEDIPRDTVITTTQVRLKEGLIYHLRQLQDALNKN